MIPDAVLRPYQAAAPGAAVLVLRDGAPVATRTAGFGRLPHGPPVTSRTSFRLASLTKAFTAKAVQIAVDEGALRLDAPIRALFPGLPSWADPIRIGHLLAHTSGVPAYESLVPPHRTRQLTDREVLGLIADAPAPRFQPGARFAYDNGGYVLLGLALELVTGRAFPDLLRERVFGPLGMRRTIAGVKGGTPLEDQALGYAAAAESGREGELWVDADQGVTTATLGDGGVHSCLEDLAQWDAALREPGFRPDPARLGPYAAPVGKGVAYGWGWYLDTFEGRRRMRHEGWSTGFQNEIQRFPDDDLAVIVLTNRAAPAARPLAEAIAREAIAGRS